MTFVQIPLVYGMELYDDADYIYESLLLIFVVLFVFMNVTMVFMDGGRAKKNLEVLKIDDFNLLNNMQEGLFVLNEE